MKNSEYWAERARLYEQAQHQKSADYLKELNRQFKLTQQATEAEVSRWLQRIADNNSVSLADARKLLTRDELPEFRWTVQEYIRYGRENALDQRWMKELENASARVHIRRAEALHLAMRQQVEALYAKYADGADDLLREVLEDGYLFTAFDIQKGLGLGWDIQGLDARRLDAALAKPWTLDGRTFSDRIWSRKNELVDKLQTGLVQGAARGDSPKKLIKEISEQFDVSRSNAERLVLTEQAYFAAEAQKRMYAELGVTQYEIVATLDEKTSAICQGLDGAVFPVSEFQPGSTAPPFHVRCRSTTCPAFDDDEDEFDIGERAARDGDGKTYFVPANMKYPEWKKAFVGHGPKGGLRKAVDSAIIKHRPFEVAKSLAEAEAFARDVLGVPMVNYKGVDLQTANEWNRGLHDSFERFPELKKEFGFVGEAHERNKALKPVVRQYHLDDLIRMNPEIPIERLTPYADKKTASFMRKMSIGKQTLAESWSPSSPLFAPFSGVTVNGEWGRDSVRFLEALAANVRSQFHPTGCDTIRSVLDHEIGHQLDNLLGISDMREIRALFDSRTTSELTQALSSYAWKNTNPNKYGEMIAEAWAEYCNAESPREIARKVGSAVEAAYRKKFGE